jgi:hypothetical protein
MLDPSYDQRRSNKEKNGSYCLFNALIVRFSHSAAVILLVIGCVERHPGQPVQKPQVEISNVVSHNMMTSKLHLDFDYDHVNQPQSAAGLFLL